MALKRIPYSEIGRLIRAWLSVNEDEQTAELIMRMRSVKTRGYLTRGELEAVCRWKSPRAIQLVKSNTAPRIRTATQRAFATRSERRRMEELLSLRGVSFPMASAILMLVNPRRYGVIDIRVWQLLHATGAVTKKPTGMGFDFRNWYQFLMIIRHFARKFNVTARDIERSLFYAHKAYQKGRLYD